MKARKNRIDQRVSLFSDEEIATTYKEIVVWKDTGVLPNGPCKIKEIEAAIREEIGWQGVHYREAEDAVLMEAGRRFYNSLEAQKSEPLSLDELQAMVGEIIYLVPLNDWAKVVPYGLAYFGTEKTSIWSEVAPLYGEYWMAYRNKPRY